MSTDAAPSHTLYVQNLNGRIHIEELKISLYGLFNTYGQILDIQARQTKKMREQAFIVYATIESATAALKSLNEFHFYDRNLKIQFANTKSHAIAKIDGTYRPLLPGNKKKTKNNEVASLGKRNAMEMDDEAPSKQAKRSGSEEPSEDETEAKKEAEETLKEQ